MTEVSGRGTPSAAIKLHEVVKAFFGWCVGRAVLDVSPAKELAAPARARPRDRVLNDDELARIIKAARQVDGPYAGIVELLAFDRPAPRRSGATYLGPGRRCQPNLDGSDLSHQERQTTHCTPLEGGDCCADAHAGAGEIRFLAHRHEAISELQCAKRELDKLSSVSSWRLHDLRRTFVSGIARLGVAPHVADKVLNHQSGTISGVAAVYQRHEFLTERKDALGRWGAHVGRLLQSREIKVA